MRRPAVVCQGAARAVWRHAALAALLLAVGCAHEGSQRPPTPVRLLEQAIEQLPPGVPIPARLNPVECGCPPWEARIGSRWVRAVLVGDDEAAAAFVRALQQRARHDLAQGALQTYAVPAEVGDTVRICPDHGALVVRVEVHPPPPTESDAPTAP